MTTGQNRVRGRGESKPQASLEWLRSLEEVTLPISSLGLGQSPRRVPQDPDHARMLAEVGEVLPPILVHSETMTIIDGRHRVLAARLRGETLIPARLFHGTYEEAYLLGVRLNIAHGKPLTLAERLGAASQILKSGPNLSDRAIAAICGLSPRTIGARRKASPQSDETSRVGEDGRTRPLNTQVARRQAADLIIAFPDDSNRSIGRSVGLSEGTVRNVRRQINRAADTSSKKSDKPVRLSSGKPPVPADKPEPTPGSPASETPR